ncbi:MAG: hydrolase TatD [Crocinitomicaceae bacterium]|nr:hydrolase TatD [Crocinitomicaceae bacterium]|tara:strand:+ start:33817 stop:34596 length:780 start_codon:yes stop_codon:yes gene_type:complete
MVFSDTHCHIYTEQFDQDRPEIMSRAIDMNVRRFFLPNIDSSYIQRLQQAVQEFPQYTYPMMGLHPCSVNQDYEKELEIIENQLFTNESGNYIGVGEIGLDLYWDKTFLKEQIDAFKIQVGWAIKLDLPIVIHVRDAFDEIFDAMDAIYQPELKGIFHCFTGDKSQAEKILEYENFKLGIGGVLTFKNSGLDEVVSPVPLDRIVLETDSPYLAPHPNRGKRNEPSYLMFVAEKLAKIKGVSLEKLSEITEQNTNEVFGL